MPKTEIGLNETVDRIDSAVTRIEGIQADNINVTQPGKTIQDSLDELDARVSSVDTADVSIIDPVESINPSDRFQQEVNKSTVLTLNDHDFEIEEIKRRFQESKKVKFKVMTDTIVGSTATMIPIEETTAPPTGIIKNGVFNVPNSLIPGAIILLDSVIASEWKVGATKNELLDFFNVTANKRVGTGIILDKEIVNGQNEWTIVEKATTPANLKINEVRPGDVVKVEVTDIAPNDVFKIKAVSTGQMELLPYNQGRVQSDAVDVDNTTTSYDGKVLSNVLKTIDSQLNTKITKPPTTITNMDQITSSGNYYINTGISMGLPTNYYHLYAVVSGTNVTINAIDIVDAANVFTRSKQNNTWGLWNQLVQSDLFVRNEKFTFKSPEKVTITFDEEVHVKNLKIDIRGTTEPTPGTGNLIRPAIKLFLNNNNTIVGTNRIVFLRRLPNDGNNVQAQIQYSNDKSWLFLGTCDLVNSANAFHNTLHFYTLQKDNLPDKYYAWLETVTGLSDPGATNGFLSNCSDAYQMVPSAGNNKLKSLTFTLEPFIGFTEINLTMLNKGKKLNYTIVKELMTKEDIQKQINNVLQYSLSTEYTDTISKWKTDNIDYTTAEDTIEDLNKELNML